MIKAKSFMKYRTNNIPINYNDFMYCMNELNVKRVIFNRNSLKQHTHKRTITIKLELVSVQSDAHQVSPMRVSCKTLMKETTENNRRTSALFTV